MNNTRTFGTLLHQDFTVFSRNPMPARNRIPKLLITQPLNYGAGKC